MIVSHRKKFIFIANGKTGTTSVEAALSRHQDEEQLAVAVNGLFYGKHIPASVLREMLPAEVWSTYFKFGFVRNPVDRFLSVWRHYLGATQIDVQRLLQHPRSTLLDVMRARSLNVLPIPSVIEATHVQRIVDLQSGLTVRRGLATNLQYPTFYAANGDCCVDFIGRYETLQGDWEIIKQRIAVDGVALPVLNTGAGPRRDIKFNDEARALIERVYEEDFKRFDYEFPARYRA